MKHFLLSTAALGGLLTGVGPAIAQPWALTSAPSNFWAAVACSADGAKLIAAVDGGGIYSSPDAGATWTQTTAPLSNWWAVASSADGAKLFAAANRGGIYCSSDSGVTWRLTGAPVTNWTSVACSTDGTKVLAVAAGSMKPLTYTSQSGPIYTSSDSGTTWTASSAPIDRWISVATSADGGTLVAVRSFGICTSKDSGASWMETNALGYTTSIACSADGTRLVLGCADPFHFPFGGPILVSTNCGAIWEQPHNYTEGQGSVASSADGTRLVAAGGPMRGGIGAGSICTSIDSGVTWTTASAPKSNWTAIASSADGGKLVAVIGGGGIYVSESIAAPLLSLTSSAGRLFLSWTVPSIPFSLQENSDLTTTNWMDVTNTPTLNFTNLQNQVTLPLPTGKRFYRLKH